MRMASRNFSIIHRATTIFFANQHQSKQEIIVQIYRCYTGIYVLSTLSKNMKPNFPAWTSKLFLRKVTGP